MKKASLSAFLLLVLFAGAAAAVGQEPELVATVNGAGIAKAEFDRSWPAFLRQKGIPVNHAEKSGQVDEFRLELLNLLIDQELLYQAAKSGGHEAGEEQVSAEVTKARGQFPSQEEFEKALSGSGLTVESYSDFLRHRISVVNLVRDGVTPGVTVSDEEITGFYAGNQQNFAVPEQVRARHILIKVDPKADEAAKAEAKKKIEEIIEKAGGGADFAELAKEYSQGPSAPRGGDLGLFPRGKMVPPFDEAVFSLEAGEISGPVLTRFGYHAIKVEEKQEAETVSREEAAEQIRDFLTEKKVAEAVKVRLESLRETAKIENKLTN
jgi:peptidyl-prolyl cis-trans isomerase C